MMMGNPSGNGHGSRPKLLDLMVKRPYEREDVGAAATACQSTQGRSILLRELEANSYSVSGLSIALGLGPRNLN